MHPCLRHLRALTLALALAACAKQVEMPVVVVSPPPSASIGSVVQLDASTSSDPQGRQLAFDWAFVSLPAGSNARLNDAHAVSPSFVADVAGTYKLTLVVSNSFRSSEPVEVTVVVAACGASAPVVGTVTPSSGTPNPGQRVVLSAPITDADTACAGGLPQAWTYSFSMIGRPAGSGAFLARPSGALTSLAAPVAADFVPDLPGAYSFKVTATDITLRESAPAFLTVTATSCGFQGPTVSLVSGAITGTPNTPLTLPTAATSDPDNAPGCALGQAVSVRWSLISRPANSSAALTTPTAAAPSFTPDHGGLYSFSVTATDSTGLTSSPAFLTLDVGTCDQVAPAVLSIAPNTGTMGTSLALSANAPDANCLATKKLYEWAISALPAGSRATLDQPDAVSPRFTPDVAGTYQVSLRVRNDQGFSSALAFQNISVPSCATAALAWAATPVVATGSAGPQIDIGDTVTLTGNASEGPNTCGSSISFGSFTWRWALVSRPQGSNAALSAADAAQPFFIPDRVGSYEVSVVATDRFGNSTPPLTQAVTTSNCGAGTLSFTGPAISVSQGAGAAPFDPYALSAAGLSHSDNTGCPARFHVDVLAPTYRWQVSPSDKGGLSANTGSPVTFSPGANATYEIALTATTAGGLSLSATRSLTVSCTTAVTAGAIVPSVSGPQLVGSTSLFQGDVITLAAPASSNCQGAASASLTYHWSLSAPAGSAATLSSTTAQTPSFTLDKPNGAYVVSLTVTDALGNSSATQSATFTTESCGANPVLADFTDEPGAKGFDPHTLAAIKAPGRITFSEDNNSAVCPATFAQDYAFSWTVLSAAPNVGYLLDAQSGALVHLSPGGNATYDVQLTVTGTRSGQQLVLHKPVVTGCFNRTPTVFTPSIASSTPGFPSGQFFRDDVATLSAGASSECFTTPTFAYHWTLTSPAGSSAILSSALAAAPAFPVDRADAVWTAQVMVRDALGNESAPVTVAFRSQACGVNPVLLTLDSTPGAKGFDIAGLTAVASSSDDGPGCPARFHNPSYALAWTVIGPNAHFNLGAFNTSTAPGTPATNSFEAGDNGDWVIGVNATGSVSQNSESRSTTLSVNCIPLTLGPISAAGDSSPHQGDHGGDFNRDDTVLLGVPADTTGCYSAQVQAGLQYAWTMSGFGLLPVATPTFSPDKSSASYVPSVTVTDKWGHFRSAGPAAFASSSCGKSDVAQGPLSDSFAGKDFDPRSLAASASSSDDDTLLCPARFNNGGYSFAFSVTASPSNAQFELLSSTSPAATLSLGDVAAYTVHAVATGNSSQVASAPATLSFTTTCTPTPVVSAPAASGATTPHAGGDFNRGDTVTLSSTTDVSACYTSAASARLAYAWTLSPAPGDTAPFPTLSTPGLQSPTFTVDQASRAYVAALTVTDRWSHANAPAQTTFNSSSCGNNPISVAIADTAGAKPMDDHSLSATATTADANPAACPASFAPSLAYAWSVAPGDGSTFGTAAAAATTFSPKAATAYTVTATVSAQSPSTTPGGSAATTIDASCAAPAVGAVQFADTTTPGTTYYDGDSITATLASVSSACKSAPVLTYAWTVTKDGSAVLTGSASTQTFVASGFHAVYTAAVSVTDDSGQTTPATGSLTVSGCGSFPPVVSLVSATQHFDAITQQLLPGPGTPAPGTLDILQTLGVPTPSTDAGGTLVPVPFFLDAPLTYAVKVSSTTGGECASFGFTGATFTDPNGVAISSEGPPAGSVSDGEVLTFTFVPKIGDVGGTPGNYAASIAVAYGAPALSATLAGPTVRVEGRCGLNSPFATSVSTPLSNFLVGQPIATDGTTSSDADNAVLFLNPAAPSSAGCGLSQTLAFAWVLSAVPAGSAAALDTLSGPVTVFTPDRPGTYTLTQTVTDGTTAAAGVTNVSYSVEQQQIAVTSAPATGLTNQPFAVAAEIQNPDGTPCGAACAGSSITLQIFSGSGTLDGSLTGTTDTAGQVSFGSVRLTPAGPYVLSLSGGNFAAGLTGTVDVHDMALRFSIDSTFSPTTDTVQAFTVSFVDPANGNVVVASATDDISLTVTQFPDVVATLDAPSSVTTASGVATFDPVTFHGAGSWSLRASNPAGSANGALTSEVAFTVAP